MTADDIQGLTDTQRDEVRKLVVQREAHVFSITKDAALDVLEAFFMKGAARAQADRADTMLRLATSRVNWAAAIREKALGVWGLS